MKNPTEQLPPQLAWLAGPEPHKALASLRAAGTLRDLLPEVDALYGVPQSPEHHPEIDTGVHIELTLEAAALLTHDPKVRFAALVHDLGKALTPVSELPQHIDHERSGMKPVRKVCERFGVPADWKQLALLVCELHLKVHRAFEMNAKSVIRLFAEKGFERSPELVEPFLLAVEADKRGRAGQLHSDYRQGAYLRAAFAALQAYPMPPGEPLDSIQGQAAHKARINAVKRVLAKHQVDRAPTID